jgi:branched-chain amino acid transport system permease protein
VTEFLQATANGVIAGGVYALVAVGFSLVWSTLDVINLAHGALVVLGAYVAWLVTTKAGVSPLVGLAASAVVLFVVGFSLERVVVARVAGRPTYTTLLLTFGVGLVLVAGMNAVFSDDYRSIPTSLSERSVALGPVRLPDTGIVAVGLVEESRRKEKIKR